MRATPCKPQPTSTPPSTGRTSLACPPPWALATTSLTAPGLEKASTVLNLPKPRRQPPLQRSFCSWGLRLMAEKEVGDPRAKKGFQLVAAAAVEIKAAGP